MLSNAARSGALETFTNPVSGRFISSVTKIASDTAIAHMNRMITTVQFRGAKSPKLKYSIDSQQITTISSGVGSALCACSIKSHRVRESSVPSSSAFPRSTRWASVCGFSRRTCSCTCPTRLHVGPA